VRKWRLVGISASVFAQQSQVTEAAKNVEFEGLNAVEADQVPTIGVVNLPDSGEILSDYGASSNHEQPDVQRIGESSLQGEKI
jgi:hypothetical protein